MECNEEKAWRDILDMYKGKMLSLLRATLQLYTSLRGPMKSAKKTIMTALRLSPGGRADLEQLADDLGMTLAAVVEEGLTLFWKKRKRTKAALARREGEHVPSC